MSDCQLATSRLLVSMHFGASYSVQWSYEILDTYNDASRIVYFSLVDCFTTF